VVLLKPTLSFNNKIYKNKIKTLHVIDPTFENFKEYLLTTKIFDYSTLLDFAEKRLFDQIMGNLNLSEVNFSKIIKKR
jgi:hypothetical protein